MHNIFPIIKCRAHVPHCQYIWCHGVTISPLVGDLIPLLFFENLILYSLLNKMHNIFPIIKCMAHVPPCDHLSALTPPSGGHATKWTTLPPLSSEWVRPQSGPSPSAALRQSAALLLTLRHNHFPRELWMFELTRITKKSLCVYQF